MNSKHKKVVVILSIGVLGIACIVLSTMNPSKNSQPVNSEVMATTQPPEQPNQSNNPDNKVGITENPEVTKSPDVTKSPKPTEGSTATETPKTTKDKPKELVVTRDAEPKVNELAKKYFKASVECDMNTLKKIVTDPSVLDEADLQKKYSSVELYKNLECYTIKGEEPGSYVVYVYEELKIADIDTLVPGMSRIYIVTDEKGKLKICSGEVEDSVQEFIQSTAENKEIIKLIETVDKKVEEVMSSDADLKKFMDKLNNNEKKTNSTNKKDKTETNSKKNETTKKTETTNKNKVDKEKTTKEKTTNTTNKSTKKTKVTNTDKTKDATTKTQKKAIN